LPNREGSGRSGPVVRGNEDHIVEVMPWGKLVWQASRAVGNSESLTVGRCVIEEGLANARHVHPNCEEVLVLLNGEIEHSLGSEVVGMRPGDVIVIPAGVPHNAKNVGRGACEMAITYSSADRQTVPAD
jgi:quercetin dioxygenase-like cupin family protein